MDWDGFALGLRTWFAAVSGIALEDVLWQGEPEGWRGRPCAFLTVLAHGSAGGTDEVRLHSQGPSTDALVQIVGNRVLTLSCKVQSREQSPTGRAFVRLERVRDALQLPSSQALFASIGIGLIEPAMLVELGRVFDRRQESEAVLDLKFTSAVARTSTTEQLGTIEHVVTERAP
jgi:hypothetical protein